MKSRLILWSGLGAVGFFGAVGGAWIHSLPPAPTNTAAPPIGKQEADALLDALQPPKRRRPLIAIVGINDATEVTDYLTPYGILRRSNVADVVPLTTEPGTVKLYPALKVEAQATVAEFDAQHPDGADYVIVPAMSRDDDPAVIEWLRSQAASGAMIIGVCAGAKVVGRGGAPGLQTSDNPLVLPQRAPRQASNDPLRCRPAAGCGRRRFDDDGDQRIHADVADLDRGHCRP
jgi:putative intracellular protease/amidase